LRLSLLIDIFVWLKGYQNGNHIEPSEQRLQEISIAKNSAVLVTLKPDSTLNVEILSLLLLLRSFVALYNSFSFEAPGLKE